MQLTTAQRRIAAKGSRAQRIALRLLTALGAIYGADRLIRVTSAHVSGVSYRTIGDPGVAFLEDFARSARVIIPTTVNPMVIDLDRAATLGVPRTAVDQQRRIARAYGRMGVRPSFSCTPYLIGNRPRRGEHVAWAESSAAVFANSVIGARTNREGGPSALASAVTGLTPNYGLHLARNRRATVRVVVRGRVRGVGWSLLGLAVGREIGGGIPLFSRLAATEDDLKWLGAALSSVSEVGMFHIERRTPEWRSGAVHGIPTIHIGPSDLRETADSYTTTDRADAIGLGSPQLSGGELRSIARLLREKTPNVPVLVFVSRSVRDAESEAVAAIEGHGGTVLVDSCLEVSMLDARFPAIATPSGKAAVYLPTLCHQKVVLRDVESLLEAYS